VVSPALRQRDGGDAGALEGCADLLLDRGRSIDDRHVGPTVAVRVQVRKHAREVRRLGAQIRESLQLGRRPGNVTGSVPSAISTSVDSRDGRPVSIGR